MKSEESVKRYIRDTFSLRNVLEKFKPLNPDVSGSADSTLAPWSLEAISLNTGTSEDEVVKLVSAMAGFRIVSQNFEGIQFRKVIGDQVPVTPFPFGGEDLLKNITVKKLMNLHILGFLLQETSKNDRPVKIEDALFDLKNSLLIPDDFMPQHLMGMVEGDAAIEFDEAFRDMQIAENITTIYAFPENGYRGPGRIRFLYPSRSSPSLHRIENNRLRESISSSFGMIRAEPSFREFEFSRILKNVIYNIEQKRNRELKRPLFDPRKIAMLDAAGVVEKQGDSSKIREDVSIDKLHSLYEQARSRGQALAAGWLESSVKLEA